MTSYNIGIKGEDFFNIEGGSLKSEYNNFDELNFINYNETSPIINILLSFLLYLESWAILYLNLSSFFIMFFCYLITPTINNFKDNSNEKIWSYLHFLTIILTIFTLIVNVIITL